MADAVVLDRWAGRDVALGAVIDNLIRLHHTVARTAARISVMTLVLMVRDDAQADQAKEALHALGSHHPARLVVLQAEPDDPGPAIDAAVTVYSAVEDDHPSSFDEVGLRLHGAVASHLKPIIEPFTLPDLPVVLWYPGTLPVATEPLLSDADAVLVDSREMGVEGTFACLAELIRRRVVVDLSWERLRPWRELTASLFEGPDYRPFAHGIDSIEVAGKPGPRRLMAGWLMSRLRTPAARVHLSDDRHIQIAIHASLDGTGADFTVARGAGDRVIKARARLGPDETHEEVSSLPDDSLAWSVARALTHLNRDRVWERAVTAAVLLPG